MQAISRKIQGDGEVFEVNYNDRHIVFVVPLGAFERQDVIFLNVEPGQIDTTDPGVQQLQQELADFAWNARHPMRVELFVSQELVPALTDNNFEGLDDMTRHKVKLWSAQARQHNHDIFFTDGSTNQDTICEVFSHTAPCRRIIAHYNLNAGIPLSES